MEKNLVDRKMQAQKERVKLINIAHRVLCFAKNEGATEAEVSVTQDMGLSSTVRMGVVDTVEFNQDHSVSVMVYFGKRRACASTSNSADNALESTVRAACAIAQITEEDPCFGLPDRSLLAFEYPDLNLYHPWDITPHQSIQLAKRCEKYAMQLDKSIINSEGVRVYSHQTHRVCANSLGFLGDFSSTRHSISCVLVAEDEQGMQRDYDYTTARDATDLMPIEVLAAKAVERTVSRLKPKKIVTQKVPVIFAAGVASSLLSSFVAAITGSNLYRQSSFLLNQLEQPIFPKFIHIDEQPYLSNALGSAAFDSDGVCTRAKYFVKEGVLKSYALGTYSARRLNLQTTGNAGGVFNLKITPSDEGLTQLLKKMDKGVLITELIGQGVNILTGDYSRGAVGFWVEQGVIQYPIDGFTVAGNLKDIFMNIVAIGNDIDLRRNLQSGSILIEAMMIAGS